MNDKKIDSEFLMGKVESRMMKIEERPDLVVLDPPRAGMHPAVVERLKILPIVKKYRDR